MDQTVMKEKSAPVVEGATSKIDRAQSQVQHLEV